MAMDRAVGRRDAPNRSTATSRSRSRRRRRNIDSNQRVRRPLSNKSMKYRLFHLGRGLDIPILSLVLVLVSIGLIMVFSASYPNAYYSGNSYGYIINQAQFAVIGIIAMLLISVIDYHVLKRFNKLFFGITIVLLVMVLAFRGTAIAPLQGTANRWLDLGFIDFQPSEVAKFTLVVMLASIISKAGDKIKTFRFGVLPCFGATLTIGVLILLERHVSATIIIVTIAAIIMFVGGIKFRWFAIVLGAAGVAILFMVLTTDIFAYAAARLDGWFDPFSVYQTKQSIYAIGSGQIFGVGLGQSRQKYQYLPEPQNDFIFAIVCEELGFIGATIIILLFVALIWRGVYVSIRAKDKFGMLVGLGVTFIIGVQTVLNICVVTAVIPNTGISLPFFSYGGTSLVTLLAEMGVLLSISRSSYVEAT